MFIICCQLPSVYPGSSLPGRFWGLGEHREQGEPFSVPVCRCGETTFGTINVILIALAWKRCYCMVMKPV